MTEGGRVDGGRGRVDGGRSRKDEGWREKAYRKKEAGATGRGRDDGETGGGKRGTRGRPPTSFLRRQES